MGEKIIVDDVQFLYGYLIQVDFHYETEPTTKHRLFIKKEQIDDAVDCATALAARRGGSLE